uniref:Uncharacterized protein n=1 Tax=Trichuris muris TaxID=70415 RepID=A0A5S6Q8J1_TRIMR
MNGGNPWIIVSQKMDNLKNVGNLKGGQFEKVDNFEEVDNFKKMDNFRKGDGSYWKITAEAPVEFYSLLPVRTPKQPSQWPVELSESTDSIVSEKMENCLH